MTRTPIEMPALDIPATGFHLLSWGPKWIACGPHFTSPDDDLGFGSTPETAAADLRAKLSRRSWWRNHSVPLLDWFQVEEPPVEEPPPQP